MKTSILFILLISCKVLVAHPFSFYETGIEQPDTIPHNMLYDLPAFTEGIIFMKDGSSDKYLFNYNCYLKEMQILSDSGDTLKLTEPLLIERIEIDSFIYYYQNGYLRQIATHNRYKLAAKKEIILIVKKGYSTSGFGEGVTVSSKGITYKPAFYYYIGDRYNNFVKANKNGFLKLFSERKNELHSYIKIHNTNFSKEKDVLDLFLFCSNN